MFDNFLFCEYDIIFEKNQSSLIRNNNIIKIPAKLFNKCNLQDKILIFSNFEKQVFFLAFANYEELSKKYRRIFPYISLELENTFYLLRNPSIDEQTLTRFKTLLSSNIHYLEKKKSLIKPQINHSERTIRGYYENLKENFNVFFENHFSDHEIPQEKGKLVQLKRIEEKTSLNKKKYELLHTDIHLI